VAFVGVRNRDAILEPLIGQRLGSLHFADVERGAFAFHDSAVRRQRRNCRLQEAGYQRRLRQVQKPFGCGGGRLMHFDFEHVGSNDHPLGEMVNTSA